MRNFAPKSIQQNEREISRLQGDLDGAPGFEAGPWPDKPATSIQLNGLWKLLNWINKGRYLIGRGGNYLWADTQIPAGVPHALYWHHTQQLAVLHVGTEVYTSDYTLSVWTKAYPIKDTTVSLADKDSWMDEYGTFVFIFCNDDVWKFDLSATNPIYYQINTAVVTTKITSVAETDTLIRGRRYNLAMARLTGTQFSTRLTSGVTVESISGGTLNVDGDYGEVFTAENVSVTNPSEVGTLQTPTGIGRWTHYEVNCTLDIGSAYGFNTDGTVNNKERYVWNNDVPVAKAFYGTMTSGVLTTAGDVGGFFVALGESESGIFDIGDKGCTLTGFIAGTPGIPVSCEITAYTSDYQVTTDFAGSDGNYILVLGNGRWFKGSQTGTRITVTDGANLDVRDSGRIVFWADGEYTLVDTVDGDMQGGDTAWSDSHDEQAFTIGHPSTGIFSRKYNDSITDDILRDRIKPYSMRTRFWEPLTDADIGAIGFGFMFTASEGGEQVQYSQIPKFFEESVGYHDPFIQTEKIKGKVYAIKVMPNIIDVKCERQTDKFLMNTIGQEKNKQTGEVINTIGGHNIADFRIGTIAARSIVDRGNGKQILVTSEPGIREYDGQTYGPNLADERITKILQKLKPDLIVSSYDEENGYIFWEQHTYSEDTITETGTAADTITETGSALDTITEV